MTASVYAVPGRLFVSPTSATVGGTELVGVENRRHEFDTGRRSRIVKGGLEQDAFRAIAAPSAPAVLTLLPRGDTTQLMQTLFGLNLATGGGLQSSGAGVLKDGEIPTRFAIVLRPFDATQKYLYSPSWQIHPESLPFVVWDPVLPRFSGAVLKLFAGRVPGGGVPAVAHDSAAAIDALYGLGGGGGGGGEG